MSQERFDKLDNAAFALCIVAAVFLLGACGCQGQRAEPPLDESRLSEPGPHSDLTPDAILRNMPANSEQRCVGISLVMEALLDGELTEKRDDAKEGNDLATLAGEIYTGIVTGDRVRYGSHVTIDGVRSPVASRKALDRLSTQVADLYKRDYLQSLETEEDREKLLDAATNFIRTAGEVEQILEADPDKTAAFAGSGERFFPDGTVKDTDHAFLLSKRETGETILYDPNDPGAAIRCNLQDTADGLIVEWECRYRDSGHITTQGYRIVHLPQYFRELQRQ